MMGGGGKSFFYRITAIELREFASRIPAFNTQNVNTAILAGKSVSYCQQLVSPCAFCVVSCARKAKKKEMGSGAHLSSICAPPDSYRLLDCPE